MKIFVRIALYFKPYLPKVLFAGLLSISVSAIEASMALFVKPLFDEVFFGKNVAFLKWIPIVLISLIILKGLFSYFHTYIMTWVGQRVIVHIRSDIFNHFLKFSQTQFDHIPTGHLMTRLTVDVSGLQEVVPVFIQILRQTLTLFALLSVALFRDWKLTIIGLSIVPFTGIPVYIIGKKLRKFRRKTLSSMGSLNTIAFQAFSGIQVVKAFSAEELELEKFHTEHSNYFKMMMKNTMIGMWINPLTEIITMTGVCAVFVLGGLAAIDGDLTPGEFFSFVAAVILMYRPIRRLSDIFKGLQGLLASGERVFETIDEPPLIVEKGNAVELPRIQKEIEFKNVWFKYSVPNIELVTKDLEKADFVDGAERDWVVKGLSFNVPKGRTVALVGSSGAGKSSVASLLPRFYDISKGGITIDGTDIRDASFKSLRNQIALVTQETFLFNESVLDNISYGVDRPVTKEEVIDAAKAADAHEFIMELSDGYNTIVGERGVKLSGGQRQRLAIARALLRNAPILILDEATSNLDSEAEQVVQKALEVLMKDRTTVVIAHRLSTIRDADKIIVLQGGEKIEEGSHTELIAKNGVYKKLYEMQFYGHEGEAAIG